MRWHSNELIQITFITFTPLLGWGKQSKESYCLLFGDNCNMFHLIEYGCLLKYYKKICKWFSFFSTSPYFVWLDKITYLTLPNNGYYFAGGGRGGGEDLSLFHECLLLQCSLNIRIICSCVCANANWHGFSYGTSCHNIRVYLQTLCTYWHNKALP